LTLFTHLISAYIVSIIFNVNPIFSMLGGILPDLIEKPLNLKHREKSHDLFFFSLLFSVFFVFDIETLIKINNWILEPLKSLILGYYFHILFDSLTISGVYFSPLKKRICLMPHFKIKTSSSSEFIFLLIFIFLSCLLLFLKPFILHYLEIKHLYEEGIIDKKEYLENLLKFF